MKFWVKLLLLYVMLIFAIGYVFQITLNHFKNDYLAQRTATQQIAYSGVLKSGRLLADIFFNEVINQPDILEQVQKIVLSEGEEQQAQRGQLYRSLAATYRRTKKDVAEILHFHFPDNRSLLRFHMPTVFGDDLTEKRFSIKRCNSLLCDVHGFESGRVLHGYRHVYPLIYQHKHIGSVEVSHPYQLIYRKVQQLETAIQTQFVFFPVKAQLLGKIFKDQEQNYVSGELHQRFVRQKQIPQLLAQSGKTAAIDDEILSVFGKLKNNDQTQLKLSQGLDFSQYVKADRNIYSIVFYSIKNVSGQAAGYLLGITPEPYIQGLINRFNTAFILIAATLFGILFYRGTLQTALVEKKKNQASLQAFFDNKLVGMVQLDQNGNYTQVNHQWEEMTGYSRDELLKINFRDLTHPDDLKKESLFEQFSKNACEKTLQLTKRYIRKDGSVFWASISGTGFYDDRDPFVGFVGMISDITKSREDQEQLHENQTRLTLALKGAKCGLWDLNLLNNKIYFDPNYYFIAGYQPNEFPQKFEEWKKRIHPDDIAKVETSVQRYLHGEIESPAVEFRIKTKSGDWMWVLGQGEIVEKDKDGTPLRFTGLNIDINKRKQAEEQHLELEAQLRQKYKMEAVGLMAGGIAHNFNNNLSIILGNVELAQIKQPQNSEAIPLLKNAKIAVLRSRDLVQQILVYSRKGVINKLPVKLASVIDETVKLLRSTIPSTINLQRMIPQEYQDITIQADTSQIQEILFNLCNNAVHAMDEKGDLTVTLVSTMLDVKDIPAQYDRQPGHYAKLSVKDTGCGMSKETLDKIFDPFFTTKEVDEGTGIGLSTVEGIVAQHEGLMKVTSTLGHGSNFDLFFPIIEQPQLTDSTLINEDLPRGTEKILFLDDDEMLAKLGKMSLTEMGYQVTSMTSSEKTLKLIRANPDYFDLVITDQTMPELSGKDLIRELLKIRADLPTILCTGYSSKINEDEIKELGISAFCMKPLDLPGLLQIVRRVLDGEIVRQPVEEP